MLAFFTSSCGLVKRGVNPWDAPPTASTPVISPAIELPREERVIREKLDNAYEEWSGTRYIWGGSTKNGIDCSAFMQRVFEDYLGKALPRTTEEQMELGSSVRRRDIKTGDMVFFKTGTNTYHVGVMINADQFLHAGTSTGVTISNLRNVYWVNTYLTTRRVL